MNFCLITMRTLKPIYIGPILGLLDEFMILSEESLNHRGCYYQNQLQDAQAPESRVKQKHLYSSEVQFNLCPIAIAPCVRQQTRRNNHGTGKNRNKDPQDIHSERSDGSSKRRAIMCNDCSRI